MKPRALKLLAIFFVVCLDVVFAPTSVAQDVSSIGNISSIGKQIGSPDQILKLTQELHLTPAQFQKVLPILQREMPKLQAIKGSSTLSDQQKVAQTKAVQQQSDSKLKTILSPQQFLSLQNFRSLQVQDLMHGALPH